MQSVQSVLELATSFAVNQRSGDHWCGHLRSNATVTAQWIFFHQSIKRKICLEHREGYIRHFVSTQHASGAWTLAPQTPGDISTSIEAYCALRILGLSVDDPVIVRARRFIRSAGGMEKMRMLTRIYLAMFGLVDWDTIPQMPPEIILLPNWFPINLYRFASWARSNIIPLSILRTREPVYELEIDGYPAGKSQKQFLDELWLDPVAKRLPRPGINISMFYRGEWAMIAFLLADILLRILTFLGWVPFRREATRQCIEWIKSHQEPAGDWAGIYPPMHLGTLALLLEDGEALDHSPAMSLGLAAMERFCAEHADYGRWMQASVSPTWDTFLMLRALTDAATLPKDDVVLQRAVEWTHTQRITDSAVGDWRVARPHGKTGGFCFEYFNSWYPDVDDTAAAVLALLHQDPMSLRSETVIDAAIWVLDMQSHDGGWAAFDTENDALFLNSMPFADMKNLCDPSTPDVTGRCLEMLGTMLQLDKLSEKSCISTELHAQMQTACGRGIHFLEDNVTRFGGWMGRWGVNYIFGTATVLCGLQAIGVAKSNPLVEKALEWLAGVQQEDGGWGEHLNSYSDISLAGGGSAPTPTQTAWAMMGLLAYGSPTSPTILRGAAWLTSNFEISNDVQAPEDPRPLSPHGTWREDLYTATGFPGHFYLGYSLYCHYFPMMALGRLLKATRDSKT